MMMFKFHNPINCPARRLAPAVPFWAKRPAPWHQAQTGL